MVYMYIRFVALQPASIPVEEMDPLDTEVRGIPDDSEEIERGLVAVNSPDGDIMWGDPDLHEDDDWEVVTPKQEFKVPVTLADHLKSKRTTKPFLR